LLMNSSLKQLANLIQQESTGITVHELAWHADGKWSIAEILEHLSLTFSGTKIVFDRCLKAGKPSASTATAKDRLRTFVVTRLGYLPSGGQAPAGTLPKGLAPEQVVLGIPKNINAMDESIGECEQRFGSGVKLVNHPGLGPLTADEWRRSHCVHGRHHLRQIRELRKRIGSHNHFAR
jgi:Protein of unknown function (DUF1569)